MNACVCVRVVQFSNKRIRTSSLLLHSLFFKKTPLQKQIGKCHFPRHAAVPGFETRLFDQTYAQELDRLVSGGLSLRLAISIPTVPAGITPTLTDPFLTPTQLNINSPVLTSMHQPGSTLITGFQHFGSAIPQPGPSVTPTSALPNIPLSAGQPSQSNPPDTLASMSQLVCPPLIPTTPQPNRLHKFGGHPYKPEFRELPGSS